MPEWFRRAFDEEYIELYAHRDEQEARDAVDLIVRTTAPPEGALVLDAPCGAGRHLHEFQRRGYRAYGCDLSAPLLREAHRRGVPAGTVTRGDIRALPFRAGTFDLVVNLFSSLGYFESDADNLAVISTLASLARPGGWVVIDFMHSEHVRRNLMPHSVREMPGGLRVEDTRWIGGEPERVNKRTTLTAPDGDDVVLNESVRLFRPEELRAAMQRSGLVVGHEFGDYHGGGFGGDSPRIVLAGQRV